MLHKYLSRHFDNFFGKYNLYIVKYVIFTIMYVCSLLIYLVQVDLDIQNYKVISLSKYHPGCLPMGTIRLILQECIINVMCYDRRVKNRGIPTFALRG